VRQLAERPTNLDSDRTAVRDDRQLLAAARAKPATFALLFERYGDTVLNYCYYGLGTWEEAEDAAQQVFTNAFAALGRFHDRDAGGSLRSWLFTIAHHEISNRRRTFSRHQFAPMENMADLADPGPSPEELAVAADRQGRVLGLLSQLSRDQRQIVELRLAGLTDREIAGVLDKSPGAVRVTQSRAVSRLRELLGPQDDDQGGHCG
jgi:RNA polymerase sigma-70 factor (ECF subfamily)